MTDLGRARPRELGVSLGTLDPGPWNAITDVEGVQVGHAMVLRGDSIRTGVTAIVPRPGNVTRDPVPGAVHCFNGFGKPFGFTQVEELGEIETPILLTSTLNVPRVADALIDYILDQPGNESVESVNPLVAETNDRWLNDARARAVGRDDVFSALQRAVDTPPDEGTVGGGTGTVALGFKGGIGTSSRRLPQSMGGHTIGVLVQTNYGGLLTIAGAPVGRELGQEFPRPRGPPSRGSVVVVVATDAPLDARNLRRVAARTMLGIGRTGAAGSNGSGDYAIGFSTTGDRRSLLPNADLDPLFWAAIEATEEAVYNSLFCATTVHSRDRTIEALPIDRTMEILHRHHRVEAYPQGTSRRS